MVVQSVCKSWRHIWWAGNVSPCEVQVRWKEFWGNEVTKTKVLVTSFPLLVWLRCLSFVWNCRLTRQWASEFHSKEFSLIDTIHVTHYRPWRVIIIIIIIIKVLTTHVFCRPVIVGSVYVMSTVVPQFLVPHGYYFFFLWTWQTLFFLLSKMFSANIAVLRGVARCDFEEKCCLHLQGLQRLCIIQDAFVPYVTFPCKVITYSAVHLMEGVYPLLSILTFRRRNFLLNFSTPCI